jgi:hypothetical protein
VKTVTTRITLHPTELGGRRGPILTGRDHRCTVFFKNIPELADHGYDCRLLLTDVAEPLKPGHTVDGIPMAFLSESQVMPRLTVGTKFYLWEGKTIGEGEITAIRP